MALKLTTQVILILCICIIGPGIFVATRGIFTVQYFLLGPNCEDTNTTNCCPGCPGFTPEEYALINALPTWLAFPLIFFSGAIIDFFGLPAAVVVVAILSLLGSVVRALTMYLIPWHALAMTVFTAGSLSCVVAMFWFHTIFQFMAIRYCAAKWQVLVMSVIYSVATTGDIVAAFVLPRLSEKFGLDVALWGIAGSNVLSPVAGLGIYLIFKFRKDMVVFEKNRRSGQTRKINCRSLGVMCKNIKTFHLNYWLVTLIVSLSMGCVASYMGNVQLILTNLVNVSNIEVADFLSYGWILQIVALPLLGLLDSRCKSHLIVASLGLLVEIIMLAVNFISQRSPLISCLLLPLPFPILNLALTPQIKDSVPESSLGLASSMYNSFTSLCSSVVVAILGLVLSDSDRHQGALNSIFTLAVFVCVQIVLFITLAFRLRPRTTRVQDEYQLLSD